jgi:hypothetical protein
MGHVNVALTVRANPSSCAASCKDEAAKARPCSFLKFYYTIEVACNFLPDVFSDTRPKFRLCNSKVAKNTVLGQGISGKYWPGIFSMFGKRLKVLQFFVMKT